MLFTARWVEATASTEMSPIGGHLVTPSLSISLPIYEQASAWLLPHHCSDVSDLSEPLGR